LLVGLGLLLLALATPTEGRDLLRERDTIPRLQPEEVEQLVAQVRASRRGPDTVLQADFLHFPRRGEREAREAVLFFHWEPDGSASLRVEMPASGIRWLLRGGARPGGWQWREDTGAVERLTAAAGWAPLWPGVELTLFDWTAPYLDWPEYSYEGPDRVAGRPVQWVRFAPPPDWQSRLAREPIAAVRLALDSRFSAPLRVEYLSNEEEVLRSVEVRSFRKVGEVWMIRRLEAFNERDRDRTEVRVRSAATGVRIPDRAWVPSSLPENLPLPPASAFERF
jgi:hypothetical protein